MLYTRRRLSTGTTRADAVVDVAELGFRAVFSVGTDGKRMRDTVVYNVPISREKQSETRNVLTYDLITSSRFQSANVTNLRYSLSHNPNLRLQLSPGK